MRLRRYVEEVTRPHFDDAAVREGRGGGPRDHQPDVLDMAAIPPQLAADVLGPAPTGLIGGAADAHAADAHELESAQGHLADFIRMLEPFQYHLRSRVAHDISTAAALVTPPRQIRYARS